MRDQVAQAVLPLSYVEARLGRVGHAELQPDVDHDRGAARVVDAGTFVGDTTWPARLIGLLITLAGIFIAGSLIGLIASAVDGQIEQLRKGRSAVLENDHVLILGWSERVPAIVAELVIANESEKRAAVIVLANEEKDLMEDTLRDAIEDPQTTRIVCRNGDPAAPKDLIRANLANSRAVICVNGSEGDAGVVKAVLAVNTLDEHFAGRHLVAELEDPELAMTLRTIMGDRIVPVNSDRLIAELTAQACRQRGLSQVFRDLLDYDGNSQQLGKNVGDDLREGKPTLPLLIAMERGTAAERDLIRHAIEHGEVARLAEIVEIVRHTGAIAATREAARREADQAATQLEHLPASEYREALLEFCARSVERSS